MLSLNLVFQRNIMDYLKKFVVNSTKKRQIHFIKMSSLQKHMPKSSERKHCQENKGFTEIPLKDRFFNKYKDCLDKKLIQQRKRRKFYYRKPSI